MPKSYEDLLTLASDARPKQLPDQPAGTDDWGSERQIDAQNLFFQELEQILPADRFAELDTWCLKATTEEMLDEGLRYARVHLGIPEGAPAP